MKYIDAEKLIAEIERRQEQLRMCCGSRVFSGKEKRDMIVAYEELERLRSIITSLQQEQPEVPNGKFVFPKYLYARTKDNKTIDMSYAPQDMNAIEYIRNDFIQQEQPELDLHNNGWIDCRKQMPKETKQWSDTLQGHREWTESELVLAWDSMYGCRVDATKNGKWMSEQRGGYTGQVVHGIIAWRPIPEFNEELLLNARKKE